MMRIAKRRADHAFDTAQAIALGIAARRSRTVERDLHRGRAGSIVCGIEAGAAVDASAPAPPESKSSTGTAASVSASSPAASGYPAPRRRSVSSSAALPISVSLKSEPSTCSMPVTRSPSASPPKPDGGRSIKLDRPRSDGRIAQAIEVRAAADGVGALAADDRCHRPCRPAGYRCPRRPLSASSPAPPSSVSAPALPPSVSAEAEPTIRSIPASVSPEASPLAAEAAIVDDRHPAEPRRNSRPRRSRCRR